MSNTAPTTGPATEGTDTDTATTTTSTTTATEPTETGPEGTPPEGTPAGSPNAEAAKWRTKLREAEGERDALVSRVEAFQKSEVERLAGAHLRKPAGLWSAGAKLENLLDDAGNVDADKVKAAAVTAIDQVGLERLPVGGRVATEGGNKRPVVKTEFEDAFKLV